GAEYAGCRYTSLDFNDPGHVVYALDPACAGLDRDDVHLQPAIRLDAIHQVVSGQPAYQSCGDPDHIFHCDCAADLAVAAAGLSRRQVRAPAADRNRLPAVRPWLGDIGVCDEPGWSLFHLRTVLRRRYRYRLHRHHRTDG